MKRLALISPLVLGAVDGFAPTGSPAPAQEGRSWNGTRAGGWTDKSGAQFIFAGVEVIGFYRRDDYIEGAKGAVSTNGATVTIKWPRGKAVLTRESPTSPRATVREQGGPAVSFALTRD